MRSKEWVRRQQQVQNSSKIGNIITHVFVVISIISEMNEAQGRGEVWVGASQGDPPTLCHKK